MVDESLLHRVRSAMSAGVGLQDAHDEMVVRDRNPVSEEDFFLAWVAVAVDLSPNERGQR